MLTRLIRAFAEEKVKPNQVYKQKELSSPASLVRALGDGDKSARADWLERARECFIHM